MRNLILILSVLVGFSTSAQYAKTTYILGPGFGAGGFERAAAGYQYNGNGPWAIYLHGDDDLGPAPTTATDYGTIDVLNNKGFLKLVKTTQFPLQLKPGTNTLVRWNLISPQLANTYSSWPTKYVNGAIEWIKANYPNSDTSCIMLVVYSLGGSGGKNALSNTFSNPSLSYVVDIAGISVPSPNYQYIADNGPQYDAFHSKADGRVSVGIPDLFVPNLNAKHPVNSTRFVRFNDLTGTDHNTILDVLMDTIPGDTYLLSNGDTWTNDETIFTRGLRFSTKRQKR